MTAAPLIHTDRGTRSATISACGRYRYTLERSTGVAGPNIAWLMLNPSTADAQLDDPTIRKVVGFSSRAGYGVALVVNLFAWRATDPREVSRMLRLRPTRHVDALVQLRAARDLAEGSENRSAILRAAELSDAVVCAWGAQPWAREQAARVVGWLAGHKLLCLGTTKAGDPLHPLMPSYDGHPLVPYSRQVCGYNVDAFLSVFYEKMGREYLRPYAGGLKSLFGGVREQLGGQLRQVDESRRVLRGERIDGWRNQGAAACMGVILMAQAIRDGIDARQRQRDHEDRMLEADMGQ